jgi:hypothetical protein
MPKPRKEKREGYEAQQCLLEELPFIGSYSISKAAAELGKHWHYEYEITYQVRGDVELWAEKDIYRVEPGDLYITKPGEAHGAVNNVLKPGEFYWMHVALPARGSLPGLSKEQTRGIVSEFEEMKIRSFPGSDEVLQYFRRLLLEHRNRGPLSARGVQHVFQAILCECRRRERKGGRK